ncbi:MAG TPA: hypothetical protein V6C65_02360 [Allocoleopsis sp.]
MKIIQKRQTVECERFAYHFEFENSPGAGFSFDCDKDGNIDLAALQKKPAALANYQKCLDGTHKVIAVGVQRNSRTYNEPAIGKCSCGCEVVLDRFTNTCDGCNRDYNMSGQELNPRCFWGEETGEHITDIMRI